MHISLAIGIPLQISSNSFKEHVSQDRSRTFEQIIVALINYAHLDQVSLSQSESVARVFCLS